VHGGGVVDAHVTHAAAVLAFDACRRDARTEVLPELCMEMVDDSRGFRFVEIFTASVRIRIVADLHDSQTALEPPP